jgi:hypothetical protein
MHTWMTFLSAICKLNTFAEGHRDGPKGMKVNKTIIKKKDRKIVIILYIRVGLWAGIAQ